MLTRAFGNWGFVANRDVTTILVHSRRTGAVLSIQVLLIIACCIALGAPTAVAKDDPSPGDMNCDGAVDPFDLEAYGIAVLAPDDWRKQFEQSEKQLILRGDLDGDGAVTVTDVEIFTEYLEKVFPPEENDEDDDKGGGGGDEGDGGQQQFGGGGGGPTGTVDLDIDSDNGPTGPGYNPTALPARGVPEESVETIDPGKFVIVNSDDDDKNRRDDYLDGWTIPPGTEIGDLVPMVLELRPNCSPCLPAKRCYKLTFGNQGDPAMYRVWSWPLEGNSDPDENEALIASGSTRWHDVWRLGDMNCDGLLSFADSSILLAAINNPGMSVCNNSRKGRVGGDCNGDRQLSTADWTLFNQMLLSGEKRFTPVYFRIEGRPPSPASDPESADIVATYDPASSYPSTCNLSGTLPTDTVRIKVALKDYCATDDGSEHPLKVPPGFDCGMTPFFSRCWRYSMDGIAGPGYLGRPIDPSGFPTNLSPVLATVVPTFAPVSARPESSTLPLIPREAVAMDFSRFPERAVDAHTVDLTTGDPLIQETDFELPFGSAVFRHTRTYSDGYHATASFWDCRSPQGGASPDLASMWDWNGRHWMISESPILLVNARYPILDENTSTHRCYFIPDAHHSIPFDCLTEGEQCAYYEAPPWSDAALEYDSATDRYIVETHRGTVRYTFEPRREDLWWQPGFTGDPILHDTHADPWDANNPGYGLPFLARIEKIEDRYGNAIEYKYDTFRQARLIDDGACEICEQNCFAKWAIKSIHLRPANSANAAWTLLYAYRGFKSCGFVPNNLSDVVECDEDPLDPSSDRSPDAFEQYHHMMIHGIYIYSSDLDTTAMPLLHVPASQLATVGSSGAYSPVEQQVRIDPAQLPPGWTRAAKYVYADSGSAYHMNLERVTPFEALACGVPPPANEENNLDYPQKQAYGLLKAVVVDHSGTTDPYDKDKSRRTQTIYRNDGRSSTSLRAIYGPQKLSELRVLMEQAGHTAFPPEDAILKLPLDFPLPPYESALAGRRLKDAADLYFEPPSYFGVRGDVTLLQAIGFEGAAESAAAPIVTKSVDRRSTAGDGVATVYYRYIYFGPDPQDGCPLAGGSGWQGVQDQISAPMYIYPFRGPCSSDAAANCDQAYTDAITALARFVVIADELMPCSRGPDDPENENPLCCTHVDENGLEQEICYDPVTLSGVQKRTITYLSPDGFVRYRKVATYGEGGGVETFGAEEEATYDDWGRIALRKSTGWSKADRSGNGASQGLITHYEYDTPYEAAPYWDGEQWVTPMKPGELNKVGVRRGTNETPRWISYIHRHPDRHELVQYVKSFPIPVADVSALGEVTSSEYEFEEGVGIERAALLSTRTWRQAAPRTLGGAPCYTYEKTIFDDRGNAIWKGAGSTTQEDNAATAIEFFIEHNAYDEKGRLIEHRGDHSGAGSPDGWVRISAAPQISDITTYEYDDVWGLSKISFPTGREQRFVYTVDDDVSGGIEQWTFPVLEPDPQNPGQYFVRQPVQFTRFNGGQIVETRQLAMTGFIPGGLTDPAAVPGLEDDAELVTTIITKTPKYDGSGRVTGMKTEAGDATLTASVMYTVGGISRSLEPDGTVTRNQYDRLGRLSRVFRGTSDLHREWNNLGYDDESDDNMVLIEKRSYGTGVHDYGMLTQVRDYRGRPAQQYSWQWVVDQENPDGHWVDAEVDDDSSGWVTDHGYDWRMRQVSETRRNSTGAVERRSYQWLDNLGRVIATAEYEGDHGPADGALDPSSNSIPVDFPTGVFDELGAQIVNDDTGDHLVSLTQMIYNARGQVQETRNFDVSTGEYTSTFAFFDFRDNTIETISPNAPTMRTVFDARNRSVRNETWAGATEVTRSETLFDFDNHAIANTNWERRTGSGDALNTSNSIRTWSYSWYDLAGRLTTTADFGTNSAGDHYESSVEPEPRIGPWPNYTPMLEPSGSEGPMRVSKNGYDEKGRLVRVERPTGTEGPGQAGVSVTLTEYDDLGRTLLVIENAEGVNADERTRTAYRYDDLGRLDRIAALSTTGNITAWSQILDWDTSSADRQITKLEYGAGVYSGNWSMPAYNNGWNPSWTPESANNAFVSRVIYPNGDEITFGYYPEGSVARRTDPRGVEVFHQYDEFGQRVDSWIDDSAAYMTTPMQTVAPADRVHHVHHGYTYDGLLASVTATSFADLTTHPNGLVSSNVYEYDARRRLEFERQQHFDVASSNSPTVSYVWAFSPVDPENPSAPSFERLAAITYPSRSSEQNGRTISFDYGDNGGSLDSRLSRVTAISDSVLGDVAAYGYAGMGRRTSSTYSDGSTQVLQRNIAAMSGGFAGLDRRGRVRDWHWFSTAAGTIYRSQQLFDYAGNQRYSRVTRKSPNGTTHNNTQSYLFTYDQLDRLTAGVFGELASDNGSIVPSANVPLSRQFDWTLDTLGNWTGDGSSVGLRRADNTDHDEYFDDRVQDSTHEVNPANQITTLINDPDGPGGQNPVETPLVYDKAGNLVFDGSYVYLYDGLNRLVAVHEGGLMTPLDFNSVGQLLTLPGDLVVSMAYDGLGRLMRVVRPVTPGSPELQIEDAYYDGVRRIQEVVETDSDAAALYIDSPYEYAPTAIREYIYGPDDADEVVCQLDETGEPVFYAQDSQQSVAALVTRSGSVPVVEQALTYEPYGDILIEEHTPGAPPGAIPFNRIGFQGLLFERLDGTSVASMPLTADANGNGSFGLYYARNRWYNPRLGRFMTRDPNEIAVPVIEALKMNGRNMVVSVPGPRILVHYVGGLNLYSLGGANPINRRDPLGLDWGMEDDIEAAIADRTGHALYSIAAINEGAKWASFGLRTALELAAGFLPGSGLYDAFKSVQVIASGKGGFWDAVNIATAAFPIAKGVLGFRALLKTRGWAKCACNSFAAGTLIATPAGVEPIEQIRESETVTTRFETAAADQDVSARPVVAVHRGEQNGFLLVRLDTGSELWTTPDHVVYSDEYGWTAAKNLRTGDHLVNVDGASVQVCEILFDARARATYNFEVDASFTYFADGVWVHNGGCPRRMEINYGRGHGGAYHINAGIDRAAELEQKFGDSVRWNQALVDSTGRKISDLRPDIQYIGSDGKIYIEEVWDSYFDRNREQQMRNALGAMFGGYRNVPAW